MKPVRAARAERALRAGSPNGLSPSRTSSEQQLDVAPEDDGLRGGGGGGGRGVPVYLTLYDLCCCWNSFCEPCGLGVLIALLAE